MVSSREIINGCLSLVPVPGLQAAFTVLLAVWDATQAVGAMRVQVETLTGEAAELLCTLDAEVRAGRLKLPSPDEDGNLPLSGQRGPAELATLYSLLVEIKEFVKLQASYGLLKMLYRYNDSVLAIETFHRRIRSILRSFKISALSKLQDWQTLNAEARIKDQESLNEKLSHLEENQHQLAEQLNLQHSSVMAMMVSLQKSLDTHLVKIPRQRRFLTHSLNYLASTSGEQVQVDNWTITSFEVEFGPQIGGGGFGQVFQGTWNKTPVALKVLKADMGAIPSASAIRSEIKAWSNLRHPHVLQFLGANVFDDQPFIVMPYLKNGNARDYCRTYSSCDRVKILHHITLGLMHLHSQRVIHGDLKALNVLIGDGENAVLCDFGLSRVKADATSRSIARGGSDNSVVGSRNWMSPERLLGGTLRKPVDIYAFGMTIYEIYTAEVPLGHIAYRDYIDLVVERDVRPERPDEDEVPMLPDELWELAEQCWAKNPKSRPDAMSVCDTISRYIAQNRNRNSFGSRSSINTEDQSTGEKKSPSLEAVSPMPIRVDAPTVSVGNEEPAPQTPTPPPSISPVLLTPPSPVLQPSLTPRNRSPSRHGVYPPQLPVPQMLPPTSNKDPSPVRSRASSASRPSPGGSEVRRNAKVAPRREPAHKTSASLDPKALDDVRLNLASTNMGLQVPQRVIPSFPPPRNPSEHQTPPEIYLPQPSSPLNGTNSLLPSPRLAATLLPTPTNSRTPSPSAQSPPSPPVHTRVTDSAAPVFQITARTVLPTHLSKAAWARSVPRSFNSSWRPISSPTTNGLHSSRNASVDSTHSTSSYSTQNTDHNEGPSSFRGVARVKYNYTSSPGDPKPTLNLVVGEVIQVHGDRNAWWWSGKKIDGFEGYAPVAYLTLVTSNPEVQGGNKTAVAIAHCQETFFSFASVYSTLGLSDRPSSSDEISLGIGDIVDVIDNTGTSWTVRREDGIQGKVNSSFLSIQERNPTENGVVPPEFVQALAIMDI